MNERMYSRASGIGKNFFNIFNQHRKDREETEVVKNEDPFVFHGFAESTRNRSKSKHEDQG
jgi:hypothetical protein